MPERDDETPFGWGMMKPPAQPAPVSTGAPRDDETPGGWDAGRGAKAPLPWYRDPRQPPMGAPPMPMMQQLAQLLGPAAQAGGMGSTQQMPMMDPAKKQQLTAFIQSLMRPGAGQAAAGPQQRAPGGQRQAAGPQAMPQQQPPQRGYGVPGMTRVPPAAPQGGPQPLSPQSPILRPPLLDDLL